MSSNTFPSIPEEPGIPRGSLVMEQASFKAKEIFDLRIQGVSFHQIADMLGFSKTYVHKVYRNYLRRIPLENAEEIRKIENAKLDQLERECIQMRDLFAPMVSAGRIIHMPLENPDGTPRLNPDGEPMYEILRDLNPWFVSVEKRLAIFKRRAALNGLDMPVKVAMTDPKGTEQAPVIQVYLPDNKRLTNAAPIEHS